MFKLQNIQKTKHAMHNIPDRLKNLKRTLVYVTKYILTKLSDVFSPCRVEDFTFMEDNLNCLRSQILDLQVLDYQIYKMHDKRESQPRTNSKVLKYKTYYEKKYTKLKLNVQNKYGYMKDVQKL